MLGDDLEELCRLGDMTKEAVALRLRAAREAIDPTLSQRGMAALVSATPQTYGNWETAVAYPSLAAMRYLFRRHRIDFNFILHGDFAQLPSDVQEKLFAALRHLKSTPDQKSN
jgi:DNA-binding XRE family transcriptional regulator